MIENADDTTLEIVAELTPGNATACGLKVRCSPNGQHAITLAHTGSTLNVAGTEVPLTTADQKNLRLHIFLDRSVMEVFIGAGHQAVTRVIYPRQDDVHIQFFATNGTATLSSLDVWQMKPIW